MKRTPLVFAIASLLACVLTATAWWRSMDFTDYVLWNAGFKVEVISTEGELRLVIGTPYILGEIPGGEQLLSHIVHFPRYALRHVDDVVPHHAHEVTLDYSDLFLATLLPPLALLFWRLVNPRRIVDRMTQDEVASVGLAAAILSALALIVCGWLAWQAVESRQNITWIATSGGPPARLANMEYYFRQEVKAAVTAGTVCLGFAATALLLGRRHRWVGRVMRGECRFCGYSLTGNVTGICSECGRAVVDGT